jgi:hypothetical protein
MNTREKRLLRTSITFALALLVLAPLASFAGSFGVSVGFNVGARPGYVWVPPYYDYRPAGYYAYAPGYWAAPPYTGAIWIAPHWGWYGHHRYWVRGYWGHRGYYGYRHGYYRRW